MFVYRLDGLRKGEHLAYTPLRSLAPFTLRCDSDAGERRQGSWTEGDGPFEEDTRHQRSREEGDISGRRGRQCSLGSLHCCLLWQWLAWLVVRHGLLEILRGVTVVKSTCALFASLLLLLLADRGDGLFCATSCMSVTLMYCGLSGLSSLLVWDLPQR